MHVPPRTIPPARAVFGILVQTGDPNPFERDLAAQPLLDDVVVTGSLGYPCHCCKPDRREVDVLTHLRAHGLIAAQCGNPPVDISDRFSTTAWASVLRRYAPAARGRLRRHLRPNLPDALARNALADLQRRLKPQPSLERRA